MNSRVIDASVVAAAFFPEPHTERARSLLSRGDALLAPDLIYGELANVIWKRWQRKEIDVAEAQQLLEDFLNVPLRIAPSAELVELALRLAVETSRSVYDCLYLALAIRDKTVMITGDRRLVNALGGGPLKGHVVWIGQSV
jgi:predicted nucleic acid-binding protein